ncbi:MAG: cyclic nucleotide-binding domain-containing protein [Myxococcales bacterium]|nr:cyclic nucleotide-binding domain-containing protein [Myxococcales bacterium]
MDFLERLGDRDRERLQAVATTVRLARGEYLIRRGERGGDFYRLVEGELEVIDSRQQPAVVLDVITRGQMVGEMGFLNEQARTADVRAGETSVCQRWDRPALLRVLEADSPFAAAFYRALAGLAVDRSRTITTTAMMGALAGGRSGGSESAAQQARVLAGRVKQMFAEAEPLIRRDRAAAQQRVLTGLHGFQAEVDSTVAPLGRNDQLAAGAELARELHAYVMRSHLGEYANDTVDRHVGHHETIAHIARHLPQGDGPLGEMIDGWLLDLPTSRALRERRALAAQLVAEALPEVRPARVLCVGANSGCLLAGELDRLGRVGAEIVCVDGSRESLEAVDAALKDRPRSIRLRLMMSDMAVLATGRGRLARLGLPPQDAIVVDGLSEYLPERVVVALLQDLAGQLAPAGRVVLTAMAAAPDDLIFRHLLAWPMIRRTVPTLRDVLRAGGLGELATYEAGSAGLVASASRAPG